jgi:polysaccharide biosynthesis/export protein
MAMKPGRISGFQNPRVAIVSAALLLAAASPIAFGQAVRVNPLYQNQQNQQNQNGAQPQAQQPGQSMPGQFPQAQAQGQNGQLPPPSMPRGGDLVLGPGDVLQIQVADEQDLDGKYLVSDGGEITVPSVPDPVHATGLTTTQLANSIAKALKDAKILQHPVVSVYVEEYHSHTVTVVGAVVRPGLYPIETHTTVLQVISEAGGLLPTAGNFVTVAKAGAPAQKSIEAAQTASLRTQPAGTNPSVGTNPPAAKPAGANGAAIHNASLTAPEPPEGPGITKLDFSKLVSGKDTSVNIEVHAGDVVSVGTAPVVYIVGAVTKPGAFAIEGDRSEITVLQALALVEGMTSVASAGHAVIVRNSGDPKNRQEIRIDINKVEKGKGTDQYLAANDILFIPESGRKKTFKSLGNAAVTAASEAVGYGSALRVAAF